MFTVDRDFSQYGEQSIILNYFLNSNKNYSRYCVDVGAFDGVVGSNSRALFLNGWAGLVVEPNPRTFSRLKSLYADRQDISCFQLAVSDRNAENVIMKFSIGPEGVVEEDRWQYAQVSTLNDFFADHYKKNYEYVYEEGTVNISRLGDILEKAKVPFDLGFLSIDCEGEDIKILKDIDFSLYQPLLICAECDDNNRPVVNEILQERGYTYHAHTVANSFFERP